MSCLHGHVEAVLTEAATAAALSMPLVIGLARSAQLAGFSVNWLSSVNLPTAKQVARFKGISFELGPYQGLDLFIDKICHSFHCHFSGTCLEPFPLELPHSFLLLGARLDALWSGLAEPLAN